MVQDHFKLIVQSLYDTKLRDDLTALKIGKKGFTYYGWETLVKLGISDLLVEGTTIKQICKLCSIKNLKMLEHILDLLVGEGILQHKDGVYYLQKTPAHLTKNELQFMKKKYPASVEWLYSTLEKSQSSLKNNTKHKSEGFGNEKSISLWDRLMQETPYSLRDIAIKKMTHKLTGGNQILDYGCGTGTSLIQILQNARGHIELVGIDSSEHSIQKAKEKLAHIYNHTTDRLMKDNIKHVKLFVHDIQHKAFPFHFDAIFLSFVINHIKETDREKFFEDISNLLKSDGSVGFYQLVHKSKFTRVPIWTMHTVDSHDDYPFLQPYKHTLLKKFRKVRIMLDGLIVIAQK